MKKLTLNETAAFLLKNDNYAILSHRRPDGDTLGSTAALCHILRHMGKTAHIVENPEITDRFRWLHEGLTKPEAAETDTLITVDVASPQMLPKKFEAYLGRIALRIDHHASSTSFTDCELVLPEQAACAEIIADLLEPLNYGVMEQALADALYVGISTDTGCFRFANTTSHTFAVAAACAGAGARVYALNQELFETNTLGRLKIQSWIVEHMELLPGGLALVAIPRAVEEALGVTEDDMDNISSFPRTVSGVKLAATLRETREGDVKLSVRAIPGWDCTRLAGIFGGGGHKGAAGATLKLPLPAAARAVEEAMLAFEM